MIGLITAADVVWKMRNGCTMHFMMFWLFDVIIRHTENADSPKAGFPLKRFWAARLGKWMVARLTAPIENTVNGNLALEWNIHKPAKKEINAYLHMTAKILTKLLNKKLGKRYKD